MRRKRFKGWRQNWKVELRREGRQKKKDTDAAKERVVARGQQTGRGKVPVRVGTAH